MRMSQLMMRLAWLPQRRCLLRFGARYREGRIRGIRHSQSPDSRCSYLPGSFVIVREEGRRHQRIIRFDHGCPIQSRLESANWEGV